MNFPPEVRRYIQGPESGFTNPGRRRVVRPRGKGGFIIDRWLPLGALEALFSTRD
jgi:hypothetical protein